MQEEKASCQTSCCKQKLWTGWSIIKWSINVLTCSSTLWIVFIWILLSTKVKFCITLSWSDHLQTKWSLSVSGSWCNSEFSQYIVLIKRWTGWRTNIYQCLYIKYVYFSKNTIKQNTRCSKCLKVVFLHTVEFKSLPQLSLNVFLCCFTTFDVRKWIRSIHCKRFCFLKDSVPLLLRVKEWVILGFCFSSIKDSQLSMLFHQSVPPLRCVEMLLL